MKQNYGGATWKFAKMLKFSRKEEAKKEKRNGRIGAGRREVKEERKGRIGRGTEWSGISGKK